MALSVVLTSCLTFALRNLELHKEEMDEVTRQRDKEMSHMKLQQEMNEKVHDTCK